MDGYQTTVLHVRAVTGYLRVIGSFFEGGDCGLGAEHKPKQNEVDLSKYPLGWLKREAEKSEKTYRAMRKLLGLD